MRIVLVGCLLGGFTFAGAAVPATDGGASLSFPADRPILIIAHPHVFFDINSAAKSAVGSAAAEFKRRQWPVIVLKLCDLTGYPPDRIMPTAANTALYAAEQEAAAVVCSDRGEHRLKISGPDVYLAGGFDNRCLLKATLDAADSAFAARPRHPLNVHLIRDAVYSDGEDDNPEFPNATYHLGALDDGALRARLSTQYSEKNWVYNSHYSKRSAPKIEVADPAFKAESSGALLRIFLVDSTSLLAPAAVQPKAGATRFRKSAPTFEQLGSGSVAW